MTRRRQQVGKVGEEAARSYLQSKGYRVAELNYRSPYGEIDLIAFHGDIPVFVEVRTRTSASFGPPAESITAEKLERLKKTAIHYMQTHYGEEVACRFDFIAVHLDWEKMTLQGLRHYRNIVG